ncbi:MAG: hypothetical protein RLP15_13880 [Cryomorphaceae bacterium]
MKTHRLIVVLAIIATLGACSGEDCTPLTVELEEVKGKLAHRDSILDAIGLTFKAIDSNMKEMRVVESEIMQQMNQRIRDKGAIRANVERMRSIMELNQNYITRLEDNLGASSATSANLFSIVQSMQEKMEMNNLRMAHLNHDLGTLGTDFKDMFEEYMQAEVERMVLQENLQAMEGNISSMEEQMSELKKNLNTVYVAIGSRRELIESGVLEKGGLLRSSDVNQDMQRAAFEAKDLRELKKMRVGAKAKLITEHPSESYRIISGDLFIDNQKLFWSISRYLIVISD